jgi:hypothetical protein
MHLWRDCVWNSSEPSLTKLLLLSLGRFMDGRGRNASMSYRQLARDTGMSERKVKDLVGEVSDRWLQVEVCKGRLVPGKGRENLYHAILPPSIAERRDGGVHAMHLAQAPAAGDRGARDAHVRCIVNQEVNLPKTESLSRVGNRSLEGRSKGSGATATNVVAFPIARARKPAKGGAR